MWPNFFVLGAAKAGTTALYDYLRQHPQVYMSPAKETNYFALCGRRADFRGPGDDQWFNRWAITSLDAYRDQFRAVTTETAVGEASPLYLYDPAVPARLHEARPDAKLVAVLRTPVERAYSAFLHVVRDGREPLAEFAHALDAEPARIAAGWEHLWHFGAMGYYGAQLERYYELFGAAGIRVFLYEDLAADPAGVVRECFRFLGVDDGFVADTRDRPNATSSLPAERRPPLRPEVRARLAAGYADDLTRLERLIGRDLSAWRAGADRASEVPAERRLA